jgi:hypothetical protein
VNYFRSTFSVFQQVKREQVKLFSFLIGKIMVNALHLVASQPAADLQGHVARLDGFEETDGLSVSESFEAGSVNGQDFVTFCSARGERNQRKWRELDKS